MDTNFSAAPLPAASLIEYAIPTINVITRYYTTTSSQSYKHSWGRTLGFSEDILSDIELLLAKAGYRRIDGIVGKAVALYRMKNVPLNHILAEVLLAHYLASQGYDAVDIEHTVGSAKCDVYAYQKRVAHCIEIEFGFVPPKHILNSYEYALARHIKKAVQLRKNGVTLISFAYPRNYVPPIPLELLRPPSLRSVDRLHRLIALVRKYAPLDEEEEKVLAQLQIHSVFIFDFTTARVVRLIPQTVEMLITLYESFLTW